jgi:hypothetical protein
MFNGTGLVTELFDGATLKDRCPGQRRRTDEDETVAA